MKFYASDICDIMTRYNIFNVTKFLRMREAPRNYVRIEKIECIVLIVMAGRWG